MEGGDGKTQRVVARERASDVRTQDCGVQNGGCTIKNNLVGTEVAGNVRISDACTADLRNQISTLTAVYGAVFDNTLEVNAVITTVSLNQRGAERLGDCNRVGTVQEVS